MMDNIGREDEYNEFKESIDELEGGITSLGAMINISCKGEVFFGTNKGGDVIDTDGKRCLSMNAVGDTCPYTVKRVAYHDSGEYGEMFLQKRVS